MIIAGDGQRYRGKDISGQKFGKLTVVKMICQNESKQNIWECVCECGNIKTVYTKQLTSGHTRSCGCLQNAKDLTGKTFGRLKVIGRSEDKVDCKQRRYVSWECICECGNTVFVTTNCLKSGNTSSCGCLLKDVAGKQTLTHGLRKTRLYNIYNNMKQRCNNPQNPEYRLYGERGIKVCDEWNQPNGLGAFGNWALNNGYADNLTLDRIDNNGDYSPENCRWVTMKEQAKNTRRNVRILYNGKTMILADFARLTGIDHRIVSRCVKNGMSAEKIVEAYKNDYS